VLGPGFAIEPRVPQKQTRIPAPDGFIQSPARCEQLARFSSACRLAAKKSIHDTIGSSEHIDHFSPGAALSMPIFCGTHGNLME
jgi:hypothetical protein